MYRSDSAKKITWYCYGITLVMFIIILLWGWSGVFRGGGQTYRLFTNALIPAVAGIAGLALGICNARKKWWYPVFVGLLANVVPGIVSGRLIAMLLGVPYLFYPLISSLIGLCVGVIVCKMRAESKIRLKKAAKIALAIGATIAAIHIGHAFTLDRIIQYAEVSFYSPNLAPELNGYRIAFISDTHLISDNICQGGNGFSSVSQ